MDLGVRYLKVVAASQRNLVGIRADRRAESPPFARWPCSTPAKVRTKSTSRRRSIISAICGPRRPMSFPCKPWSFAVRLLPTTRTSSPTTCNGWKRPRSRDGPADRKGGWSYGEMPGRTVAGDGSNSQFALLALYEAGRVAETGQIQRHHPPRDLGTRPQLLDQQPARGRRLLGLLQAHARHRQHDLCRHFLAGDCRRRAPRARRQSDRRPDRRLLSGPLGRPGPDRPGHRLAAAALHRPGQSARRRPPAAASGITIISTAWSAPDGSPRGARSASTIGIAKGPATWSRPSAPSSRGVPGKAAATPKTTKTSPPAWPCCSSPRDAGPCSWPRCNMARRPSRGAGTSTGIATATTSTTSRSTSSRSGGGN